MDSFYCDYCEQWECTVKYILEANNNKTFTVCGKAALPIKWFYLAEGDE